MESPIYMMIAALILTLVVILATYVYVRWRQVKQYWAKRNITYVPPNPFLGSLKFLQEGNPAPWYRRMYEKYKEPYVGIWIFWRPALLVNSREITLNILIRDQANFRNRLASSGTTDPVGSLNLFTVDDPLWTLMRRRLTHLFTSSKLRGMQKLLTEKSKELVKRLDIERKKSEPIDTRTVMTDFSTDIIGTSAFGLVSDATLTGDSLIRAVTKEYTKFDLFRVFSWCCIFFIPELVDFFRCKMFPSEITEDLRKILRKIIDQRGGLEKKVTEPRDLLDILIKIKQEDDQELEMTENMMLAHAAFLLQAGFETSGLALSFGIYELAFHPEVQEKMYKELKEAEAKYGEELMDGTILSQLTYFNCVINETLRKYPALPGLDRVALQDYKVDDHLTIKAGTPVVLNVLGLHYDPDIYPNPEKFDPDRFLPENESDSQVFMPFGDGPRKCIGQRFGYSTVRHGMAAIVLNYKINPLPNAFKPSEITFDKNTLFIAPGDVLAVDFVPRN